MQTVNCEIFLLTTLFLAFSWSVNPKSTGLFVPSTALTLFRLGSFVPPSVTPLFHYLWSNYNQTWHDDILGQNPSKAIKNLLTSSPGSKHYIIKQFFWYRSKSKFEFLYLLSNGAEIWHRGSILRW